MRYSKNFCIICTCDDVVYNHNENDETLNSKRACADESGYDADMEYYMWIHDIHIRINFGLFGLDFSIMSVHKHIKPEVLDDINKAIKITYEWFEDKYLDDISEKLYSDVENILGKKIFEAINKSQKEENND